MSRFRDHERRVSRAIDTYHGERTRIEAVTASRYVAGSVDPAKPPVEAIGVVDIDPVTMIAQDKGKYDGLRPALQTDRVHVSFDETVFETWKPEAGTRIVLLERKSIALRVSRCEADGYGRLLCYCNWDGA